MISRRSALLASLAFGLAAPLFAPAAYALKPEDEVAVAQANAYLDQVRTLKAKFVQEAQDGTESTGMIYLDRPGKLRLEYDPPSPILVVAKGDSLVYYDRKLQQVSYVDLDQTMASVLIRDHVKLDGDSLKVLGVAHLPSTVEITVAKRDDPHQGRITLVFTEKPFELRQWSVVDAQGATTLVTLSDAETGLRLDPALFVFHDPRPSPGEPRTP